MRGKGRGYGRDGMGKEQEEAGEKGGDCKGEDYGGEMEGMIEKSGWGMIG